MNFQIDDVCFDEKGLLPAIVQDGKTLEILTLAYMNKESLRRTLETGETWFWSRSRNELWHKGATSGNIQKVVDIRLDCDEDTIVVQVETAGPACHTGAQSCFHNTIVTNEFGMVFDRLYAVITSRKAERPEDSYTTYLFDHGLDKILKKIGEESAEIIIAAKNGTHQELVAEISDLIYHISVLMVESGVTPADLAHELAKRATKRMKNGA
ncbi:MAG: bifunctional phosphoribosyl-AMP cyclohydrolase/phosphoribosyl-ATP diphosphatase HisIE [Pyrinomonadaceae bacterium]